MALTFPMLFICSYLSGFIFYFNVIFKFVFFICFMEEVSVPVNNSLLTGTILFSKKGERGRDGQGRGTFP